MKNRRSFYALFVVINYILLINLQICLARKQGFNPTSDFLFHETGRSNNGPKSQNNLDSQSSVSINTGNNPLDTRDYVAQFPSLPSQTKSTPKTLNSNSGKRDYVAPKIGPIKNNPITQTSTAATTRSVQSSGKRDYVNPKLPLNNNNAKPAHTSTSATTQATFNSGKRDYINPQFPPLKADIPPTSTGTVKDLINFYDSKNTGQGGSYSSVLKGKGDSKGSSIQPQLVTQKPNPRPTKPSTTSSTISYTKPHVSGMNHQNPDTKPGLVLPSSIVNKNTKNQGASNTNVISDNELQALSEELLRKDTNNAAKLISINYQEKTTSQSKDDKAPLPLLTVPAEVWNIPTIQKFLPLLDNYERDTLVNEYVTPQERNEENAFMDAIMSTTVIRHLMNFLKNKGYVTADTKQQRDYLKQLWFTLYSRGKGKISSSGFEHVFVSELKNGEVSGLHNWIYFSKEESANRLNYLGYLKYLQLNDKGAVMKIHFNQQGVDKPVDSLFIGTSPELEISLYTLCFVVRSDDDCKLKLGGKDVSIVTHTFRYRSKNYIGSAYAQI